MTDVPKLLVQHVTAVGQANGGELVTLSVTDRQGRPLIIALPYAQALALLAPLTAAVGSAHQRLTESLGNEQAVLDVHRLAGFEVTNITVGRLQSPGAAPKVLLRVNQNEQPFLDLFVPLSVCRQLSDDLEGALDNRDGSIVH